jgi:hypothetical protein
VVPEGVWLSDRDILEQVRFQEQHFDARLVRE